MQIPAGEFKAKCLQLMELVARSGKSITITKRGKPVAKLVPADAATPRASLFGRLAGTVAYEHDLISPLDDAWDVLRPHADTEHERVRKKPVAQRSPATRRRNTRP